MIAAPRSRGALIALLVAGVALFALACGGGDDKKSSSSASPAAPGAAAASDKKVKVGFLYVGSVDDAGYNQAAYQGQLAVAKLPNVETIKAENVPENAEAERVMEQMIQQGATIIFPTSYGHLDPALKVAAKYPNVTFLHEGGLKTAANLGNFFGTIWQGQYLAGMAAGRQTKSNKLGFIAAFPIPQTLLNINAFELGAKSVNPAATTTVIFTGNWCDAGKNAEATKSLVDQKVDVVTQHQDCTIPVVQAAEKAGIMTVGYHADASKFAPNGWITAPVWDWSKLFPDLVTQIREGTYKANSYRGGLKEGIVTLAPWGKNVPKIVQDEVMAAMEKMKTGDLSAFKGPVKDQDGKVRIKEGETPTVDQLEASDYLVEGVIGKIPS
jgi:basic membrane lipoprotein Med (substrate-binding protein (PBP1-ABC) superfamily)